jgi:hypothetical protein
MSQFSRIKNGSPVVKHCPIMSKEEDGQKNALEAVAQLVEQRTFNRKKAIGRTEEVSFQDAFLHGYDMIGEGNLARTASGQYNH